MTQVEFLGNLVIVLVPLAAVIAYFAKASWNLATSITHLEETIKYITVEFNKHSQAIEELASKVHKHDLELNDLKNRCE